MSSALQDEAIDRAIRHVSTGWLPPQRKTLDKIQAELDKGTYQSDRKQLQAHLKDDVALYMYCLRELSERLHAPAEERGRRTQESRKKLTPTQIFEQADLEVVREILTRSDSEISLHSMNQMNQLQALRFRESVLSASAVEVLAETNSLDPETGYSCGLLRQFGLTLIAWNYPRVYARAIENLNPQESLDGSLQKVLGFSPAILGVAFARRWNLSDEILVALGDRQAKVALQTQRNPANDHVAQAGDLLAKICEVGEALARANHPEQYPTALNDWEKAHEAIAAHLGPTGVQRILERATEYCREYLDAAPELQGFSEGSTLKERIVDSRFATTRLEKNTHLRACPPAVRDALTKVYYQMKPNKILKKNVRTLMFEVAPQAGFSNGCVFMLEPSTRTLSPAVKIGEVAPERMRPLKLSSTLSHFDLVTSAFSLKSPLREERSLPDGRHIVMFACSLGQAAPVGVLFLETDPFVGADPTSDVMPVFRAIRQTLCDCLNLL